MSADKWSPCPKCWIQAQDLKNERVFKCDEAYGRVSISEFFKLKELADAQISLEDTMREDYENYIGEDDGVFTVSYSASCQACGFKFTYEHTEQVDVE